jgi:hypothetical protein
VKFIGSKPVVVRIGPFPVWPITMSSPGWLMFFPNMKLETEISKPQVGMGRNAYPALSTQSVCWNLKPLPMFDWYITIRHHQ